MNWIKIGERTSKKCNEVVVPEKYDFITDKIKIFNSSCEDLYHLLDKTVQLIVCSPHIFQARVYKMVRTN